MKSTLHLVVVLLAVGVADACMQSTKVDWWMTEISFRDDLQECFPSYESFIRSIDFTRGEISEDNWEMICHRLDRGCIYNKIKSSCLSLADDEMGFYMWNALYVWPYVCAESSYEGFYMTRKCFLKHMWDVLPGQEWWVKCDPSLSGPSTTSELFDFSGSWLPSAELSCGDLTHVVNCFKSEMLSKRHCPQDYYPEYSTEFTAQIWHDRSTVDALRGRGDSRWGECEKVREVLGRLELYYGFSIDVPLLL